MASDHEHSFAQHVQALLSSYYASLLGDQSRPGVAHSAFSMAVSELRFPLLVVLAPSAGDYEAFANFQRELQKYNDQVNQFTRDIADISLRKKQLKTLKKPAYSPRKGMNLEVLGVLRLDTDLILQTVYDKKFPESKIFDVSDLIVRFLERVLEEHRERLGIQLAIEDNVQSTADANEVQRSLESEQQTSTENLPSEDN